MSDPTSMTGIYRRISLRILPILFCCYLINYLDRMNLSYAKKEISLSLGLDDAAYGLGAGLFFIGYFFFQVPSNLLLHRIGARKGISLIMVLWGLVSAATAFVQTEVQFYAVRLALGASEAGFFPGVILYLTWWYPSQIRARVLAIFLTAIPVAGLIGSPISGWILSNFQGGSLHHWQWLFLLEGLPCVVVALWVFTCLPDLPANASWLPAEDRKRLVSMLEIDTQKQTAAGKSTMTTGQAFRNPMVWKLCLLYFCTMMGLYGVTFWLPTFIESLGWKSQHQIGLFGAIPWFVAVLFMLKLGSSSDQKQERRRHAAFASLIAVLGFSACGLAQGGWPGLAAMSLAAAGVMGMMAVQWSLPGNLLGGSAAAAGIALINSFGNLGGFVSPTIIGYLTKITGSSQWGFFATACFVLVPAILLMLNPALEPHREGSNGR